MLLTAVAWCALVCNKSNIYCPADKTTPAKKDEPHGPPMLKKAVIQDWVCFLRIKSARRMRDDKRREEQCLFR